MPAIPAHNNYNGAFGVAFCEFVLPEMSGKANDETSKVKIGPKVIRLSAKVELLLSWCSPVGHGVPSYPDVVGVKEGTLLLVNSD